MCDTCMLFIRRLIYDRILLIVSYVYVIDSIATADIDGSYCPSQTHWQPYDGHELLLLGRQLGKI